MGNYNKILKYKDYKKMNTRVTSGIVFIYGDKILLVHPTDRKWTKTFSYPKGKVNSGESIKNAAIRETEEEIGVKFSKKLLSKKNLYKIVSWDEEFNGVVKIDYYYLIYLDDDMFEEYFKEEIINNKNLQKSEIDWGGFMSMDIIENKIKNRLKPILSHKKKSYHH